MKKLSIRAAMLVLLTTSGAAIVQADSLEAGRKVFEKACARCHESGIMGAPVVTKPEQWTEVSKEVWSDVQFQHLEEGFLHSKGEKAISEEDVKLASQYMMSIVH